MLLIVEDNWGVLISYRNYLSTLRMVEGIDYVYARSYSEVADFFADYQDQIKAVIVDHELEGRKTGLDVINSIRRNEDPKIKIIACSTFMERNYPNNIPFFNRLELREAVDFALKFL